MIISGVEGWKHASIADFFAIRPTPSQNDLDEYAASLIEGSTICPVGMQGSLSYTVVAAKADSKTIVSFRTPPEQAQWPDRESGSAYFARCWDQPQELDPEQLETKRRSISRKLSLLENAPGFEFLKNTVVQLRGPQGLACLYSEAWPQVVTHGDLSQTNILVGPETLAITGLVDWSLAKIAPFGLELSALRLLSGAMSSDGWTDRAFRPETEAAFWDEFWRCTAITDAGERETVRKMAELSCKLGVILRYAFRNLDGFVLDQLAPKPDPYLRSWLGNEHWGDLIAKDTPVN
ncbi:hypothetical protein PG996_015068 [Apiospora saccharicola]|uniref:Aminoglycoside phosphotransferase domain-containing protein n=1 Tax=Apiospora saccharicola TaxID=335842 RepID=A0ABR1TK48_9PEZI